MRQTPPPATPSLQGLETARVTLTRLASFDRPLAMALRPGDDNFYIAEKGGRIRAYRNGQVGATVLDISPQVSGGGEQGLLGLAFSADGSWLYVNFTDTSGDTVVREYPFSISGVDTTGARDVLNLDQPASNHNGGNLVFGPDGYLYIGLGDGGSGASGNAQNLDTLLGKMLRIDPRPSGLDPYRIPPDNPFVGGAGRDEIWAFGLRNPWRYSFDRASGDLLIGDVGQNSWEEVSHQPASSGGGENYGWSRMEGSQPFGGASPPPGHVPPIYEYANSGGNCAVTAGYVYQGSRIPALRGAYVFADYCAGQLRAFLLDEGQAKGHRFLGPTAPQLSSFGEDGSGELYVLSLEGGFFRIDPA